MHSGFRAWAVAAFVILVWGITFVNTRALLEEFSALEILVGRFGLAWVALWGWGRVAARPESAPYRRGWCDEWLFAAMGFCGIFCHRVNKRAHGEIHLRQGIGSQAAEASVAIRRLRTGWLLDHGTIDFIGSNRNLPWIFSGEFGIILALGNIKSGVVLTPANRAGEQASRGGFEGDLGCASQRCEEKCVRYPLLAWPVE